MASQRLFPQALTLLGNSQDPWFSAVRPGSHREAGEVFSAPGAPVLAQALNRRGCVRPGAEAAVRGTLPVPPSGCLLCPSKGAEKVTGVSPDQPSILPDTQVTLEPDLELLSTCVSRPSFQLNSLIAGEDVILISCQVSATDRHYDLFFQERKTVTPCYL